MSWISRTAIRAFLAGAVGAAVLAVPATARAANDEYVKYYTVTSAYKGAPENLTEIATRFLGTGTRSAEIFDLNTGRKQPDGKMLADPSRLRSGWLLVMPWDAVGSGLNYGVLPEPAAAPKATKTPTAGTSTPAVGGATPAPGTRPSAGSAPPTPTATAGCASAAASSTKSDWARLRLAADKAWPQSRGKGQLVAVVDSGVNGAMPQLTGHVTVGVDAVQPNQRGDVDCLGTGTSMAALVVAKQVNGAGPVGAAPDATVMPVRIAVNQPAATPEVQVKAIEAAASAGATVIALGGYVDPADVKVAQAITAAISRNVVVVLGAPAQAKPADPQAALGEGALRVAGIGVDDKSALDYRKGAVDVSAPGVNVSSLGGTGTASTGAGAVTGSGTHYAVAYAAAAAALVRSAYPELTAQQVTHRIKVTADQMGDGEPPHSQYGWGFLNPGEAVTKVLVEEAKAAPPAAPTTGAVADAPARGSSGSGGRSTVLIVTAILMIAAALLLGRQIWRLLHKDSGGDDFGGDSEPEIDLYDTRFRTPAPVGTAPSPPGRGPFDDGADHWTDGSASADPAG